MKRVEPAELTSQLLLASAVIFGVTPLLLGDQLLAVVTVVVTEGTSLVDQILTYLVGLLS